MPSQKEMDRRIIRWGTSIALLSDSRNTRLEPRCYAVIALRSQSDVNRENLSHPVLQKASLFGLKISLFAFP